MVKGVEEMNRKNKGKWEKNWAMKICEKKLGKEHPFWIFLLKMEKGKGGREGGNLLEEHWKVGNKRGYGHWLLKCFWRRGKGLTNPNRRTLLLLKGRQIRERKERTIFEQTNKNIYLGYYVFIFKI